MSELESVRWDDRNFTSTEMYGVIADLGSWLADHEPDSEYNVNIVVTKEPDNQ